MKHLCLLLTCSPSNLSGIHIIRLLQILKDGFLVFQRWRGKERVELWAILNFDLNCLGRSVWIGMSVLSIRVLRPSTRVITNLIWMCCDSDLVCYVGVGWALLGMVVLSIIFSWPSALISTELISLMPSFERLWFHRHVYESDTDDSLFTFSIKGNHGQIAWSYRAFRNFKVDIFGEPIGDLLGFLNCANILLYYVFSFPIMPIIFVCCIYTVNVK